MTLSKNPYKGVVFRDKLIWAAAWGLAGESVMALLDAKSNDQARIAMVDLIQKTNLPWSDISRAVTNIEVDSNLNIH